MNATIARPADSPAATSGTGVTVIRPAEVPATWLVQELMEPLVTAAMSGGKYDLLRVIAAPNGGPPPHRHSREDEIFYIVDGTFAFVFDDMTFTAGAGEAVFLPRGVTHTYNNVGDKPGTLMVFATPSGFGEFVAAGGYPCTDRATKRPVTPESFEKLGLACDKFGIVLLPAWKADKPAPARTAPPEVWCVGLHIKLLLTGEQTRGAVSVAEITAGPGDFVPPHWHKAEDEMFYVLDGVFEFDTPAGVVTAEPGTLVHVPKGVLHGFRNAGERPAKVLNYHTPGGFDRFFVASGTTCTDRKAGPPKELPDMEEFVRICKAHGMELPEPR